MSKVYPMTERLANRIVSMVEEELNEYSSDNVDVVLNEETGKLDIMYHSDNNSFLIRATDIDADKVDLKILEEGLDEFSVGHVW
jgi:hypothetical protein